MATGSVLTEGIPSGAAAVVPNAGTGQRAYRLTSIDMLRGLVIVIMAIDHVRDFFLAGAEQDPTTDPNIGPALFATRWITHFCAPVFVLLAGTSAGLMVKRKTPSQLSTFLLTRGLWLLFVETVVLSTLNTFSPRGVEQMGGQTLTIMQVIWAIGGSMIVLAAAQWMGRRACLAIGATILLAHNFLDPVWPAATLLDTQWPLWVVLHAQMSLQAGPFYLLFVYPILPWIGVMLFGFGAAELFELPAERRNPLLVRGGAVATAAFLLLRGVDLYGDPNHWGSQPAGPTATVIDFLNTTKYPPSLLFLLMTLGPAAIVCGLADRMRGAVKDALVMFGRVPFAFYVPHFLLIHTLSVLLGLAQGFTLDQMTTVFLFYPEGYGVGLGGVYVAWALVIALLYPWCRWVAGVKARRRDWWLSYV
jgi:uncharacterized membrane protein